MLANIVFLFCSSDVGALGLGLSWATESATALGRLAWVGILAAGMCDVGLRRDSS